MFFLRLKRFVSWWVHELGRLIPDHVSYAFTGVPTATHVTLNPDRSDVKKQFRGIEAPFPISPNHMSELVKQLPRGKRVVDLIWPDTGCLSRRLSLPKTSRGELEKVLSMELARATPLAAKDVMWDYRMSDISSGDKQTVHQLIVKSDDVFAVKSALLQSGVSLRRVRITGCDGKGIIADHSAGLAARNCIWRRANAVLALAILGLIGFVFYQPHMARLQALESANQDVERLSEQAVQMRREISLDLESSAFGRDLEKFSKDRPRLSDVLVSLTDVLPDTVWLNEIVVRQSNIGIQGTTRASAADLVLRIGAHEVFSGAALSGPVSRARDGNGEKFALSARVGAGGS